MFEFKVRVPLIIEQKGNYNKHDFSTSQALNFNHKGTYENCLYELLGENDKYSIIIEQLHFNKYEECMKYIESFLKLLMPICSLLIQDQHINQHYSHIKLNYNISEIKILEQKDVKEIKSKMKDNECVINIKNNLSMRNSVSIKSIISIDFTGVEELIKPNKEERNFNYILGCYYRAIGATEFHAKYYNAFIAIEFIENKFKNKISTHLLLEEEVLNDIIFNLEQSLNKNENKNIIINRFKGTIKCATFESRAEKLFLILRDIFEIDVINKFMDKQELTIQFLSGLIKIRNSLFHGKRMNIEEEKEMSNMCLDLMLLVQKILLKWNELNL